MLFSVIIPVYNVEAYLPRCIDSVLKQVYKDYEILLIDDGSTDGSGKICDEYVQKHEQCRVVHKANAGLASARNTGLDMARGTYIVFLDSDDYIEKELLMKVAQELEGNGYDTCSYAARRIAEDGSYLYEMRFDEMIRGFDFTTENRLCFLLLDYLQYKLGWEACFYVYRRAIIEKYHLRFKEEITYAEDLPFTFQYMLYTKNLIKIPDILYNYTCREASITALETEELQIRGMFECNYAEMKNMSIKAFPDRKGQDLEVLLYAAMLLYFVPQYAKNCSRKEIRERLLSCRDSREIWDHIRRKKKLLSEIFEKEAIRRIMDWIEQK